MARRDLKLDMWLWGCLICVCDPQWHTNGIWSCSLLHLQPLALSQAWRTTQLLFELMLLSEHFENPRQSCYSDLTSNIVVLNLFLRKNFPLPLKIWWKLEAFSLDNNTHAWRPDIQGPSGCTRAPQVNNSPASPAGMLLLLAQCQEQGGVWQMANGWGAGWGCLWGDVLAQSQGTGRLGLSLASFGSL